MNLLTRLFVLVAVATIPALAAHIYAAHELLRDRERMAHSVALSWAKFAASEFELLLEGARAMLTTVSLDRSVREQDGSQCGDLLSAVHGLHSVLGNIAVVRADGSYVCSSTGSSTIAGLSATDRPWFQEALKTDKLVVSPALIGRTTKQYVMPLAMRLSDSEGRPNGVIFTQIRINQFKDDFVDKLLPLDSSFSVIARDGTVVLRIPQIDLSGTRIAASREWMATVESSGTAVSPANATSEGLERIVGYVPLSRNDLVVAVGVAPDVAFADLPEVASAAMLISALGLILALAAASIGARAYVERPINRLAAVARRWTSGDLSVRATTGGSRTELDQLAQSFNTMAAALAEREREQQEHIAQLRTLIGELNHRTKNSLAAVQAMVRQGARSATSLETFLPTFETRLLSYSKAHDLLSENNWQPTSLKVLAPNVVAPFINDKRDRFVFVGDDAPLVPQTALALAMAFGELANNAIKFGALSAEGGYIRLEAELAQGTTNDEVATSPRLRVTWTEYGGPSVVAPTRKGFGSRLLEQLARSLNGAVDLRFNPAGVSCEICFPIAA